DFVNGMNETAQSLANRGFETLQSPTMPVRATLDLIGGQALPITDGHLAEVFKELLDYGVATGRVVQESIHSPWQEGTVPATPAPRMKAPLPLPVPAREEPSNEEARLGPMPVDRTSGNLSAPLVMVFLASGLGPALSGRNPEDDPEEKDQDED